jgi:hypothetical protein
MAAKMCNNGLTAVLIAQSKDELMSLGYRVSNHLPVSNNEKIALLLGVAMLNASPTRVTCEATP